MDTGNGLSATPKGIIFDLDGTLYHMRWYMRPIMFLWLIPHSFRLPRFIRSRETLAGVDWENSVALYHQIGIVCEALPTYSLSASEWIRWIQCDFYKAFVGVMTCMRYSRPHLNTTLNTLRQRGIKLGVLSDYGKIEARLKNLAIPVSLFDTIASSEEVGALKPHPRPFLEIAKAWNIDPEQVLVVGDRIDTDGEAAKAAGMNFVQINDRTKTSSALSWPQLRTFLAKCAE